MEEKKMNEWKPFIYTGGKTSEAKNENIEVETKFIY